MWVLQHPHPSIQHTFTTRPDVGRAAPSRGRPPRSLAKSAKSQIMQRMVSQASERESRLLNAPFHDWSAAKFVVASVLRQRRRARSGRTLDRGLGRIRYRSDRRTPGRGRTPSAAA
ncbi:hypothetical protein A5785_21255 [Gordonia sp. 852002-50395_SCH5434458]|nr:hypothetical protein A5766_05805 [Gordonia sp. 852002-51296_SCH5728562-b]OBB98913.1 hypothetical protein A5785_21255 [Gordonia sp. 852002-50395_SCH5434458]